MPISTNSKSSGKKQNIPPPSHSQPHSHSHSQPPSHSQPHSQPPSMIDSMKQGFGFGIGSAIAHNLFRTNNKDEEPKKSEIITEPKLTDDKIYEVYNKCLEKNDNNIDCTTILHTKVYLHLLQKTE